MTEGLVHGARVLEAFGRHRLHPEMRRAESRRLPEPRLGADVLPNVRNVRTALALDLIKDEPLMPIEEVEPEKA